MEIEVECPSGLAGKIRAWKVKDRAIYKDQKVLRSNTLVKELVQRCWIETTSPGPYSLAKDGTLDWGRVLQGDAFWAFIQSRRISKGDIYTFRVPCKSCQNSVGTPFDLSEMHRQDLPEESMASVKDDTPIVINVNGREIKFRLLRTEDNKKIAGLQDNFELDDEYSILAARIVEVEGLGKGPVHRVNFVKDLDEMEADAILQEMEKYDCGAEAKVELICEQCYYRWQQNLPLQPSFFQAEKQPSTKTETNEADAISA